MSGVQFSSQKSKQPAVVLVGSSSSVFGQETIDRSRIVKYLFSSILDRIIYISTYRAFGGSVAFADPRIFDVLVMQFGSVKNAGYLYVLFGAVRFMARHIMSSRRTREFGYCM